MSVISSRQLSRVERIVHQMDPTAFMVVNRVQCCCGRRLHLSAKAGSGRRGDQCSVNMQTFLHLADDLHAKYLGL